MQTIDDANPKKKDPILMPLRAAYIKELTVLKKLRKSHILFFICVFGLASLCLTNGFAIPADDFDFPTPNGVGNIEDNPEPIQKAPQFIFGSADFEKMRDLPPESQDYQLGTKVGLIRIPTRDDPNRSWICTGFLVGPDLFLTNHHCIHDDAGLLPLGNARIYMDYYQDRDVDPTLGGITARVSEILRMDEPKDYALLRLDNPIGDTYGWLELDTTTRPSAGQNVKIIHHSAGRSKEISRRNSQIVDIPADFISEFPELNYALGYLADTERGASGAPVFMLDGTGVVAINHSGWFYRIDGEIFRQFNAGTLMTHIVPEIQQWLPGDTPPDIVDSGFDLVVENPRVNTEHVFPGESFTLSVTVRNQGVGAAPATTLQFYESFDATITVLDIPIDTASVGSLEPAATSEVSVTIPTFSIGTSYYGACIETVANETDPNNNCSTGVSVTVSTTPPPPSPGGISFNPPTIDNQTFTVNVAILPVPLPIATGGTPPYAYTLSPIPDGLHFDEVTQILSGTPSPLAEGITNTTYTATDAIGESASLEFTIEVLEEGIPADSPVDVNGDGVVNVADLVIVAMAYGTQVPPGTDLPADVNSDGVVNLPDLILVARAIDAASGGANAPSLVNIETVAEVSNALSDRNLAYRNVAVALVDARKLEKGIPETVLKVLQHLLIEMEMAEKPESTALLPNYPNPFNPETWIPYHLAKDAEVTLTIYNVRGVAVRELTLGHQAAGVYQSKHRAAYWDGKNQLGEKVASGLYFYTLTAGDFTATRKMLIAK
ncbi:hypothetical protein C6499_22890 [Candidatus Poribacteria bacterium]|nr:MAG: hypothetical protein C6499_22890 [Candidatus Poribacteria bacterium]